MSGSSPPPSLSRWSDDWGLKPRCRPVFAPAELASVVRGLAANEIKRSSFYWSCQSPLHRGELGEGEEIFRVLALPRSRFGLPESEYHWALAIGPNCRRTRGLTPPGSPRQLETLSIGDAVDWAGFCDNAITAVDYVRNRLRYFDCVTYLALTSFFFWDHTHTPVHCAVSQPTLRSFRDVASLLC